VLVWDIQPEQERVPVWDTQLERELCAGVG